MHQMYSQVPFGFSSPSNASSCSLNVGRAKLYLSSFELDETKNDGRSWLFSNGSLGNWILQFGSFELHFISSS
uniref:Putative ovule protein n=1 Tax=Solanum chacoense TaxID=4108 RepID=A0A0V0GJW0_SOLCH